MKNTVEKAAQAVGTSDVQEMIKKLSEFGLGVYALHEHSDKEEFLSLAPNRVSIESDLKVSFCNRDDLKSNQATPVGWAWIDGGVKVVAGCRKSKGGHN
jgi:hypothetical protein